MGRGEHRRTRQDEAGQGVHIDFGTGEKEEIVLAAAYAAEIPFRIVAAKGRAVRRSREGRGHRAAHIDEEPGPMAGRRFLGETWALHRRAADLAMG